MPMALRNSAQHPSGCRYRFELSIDPGFLQVPISPVFALIPSRLATCSKAILCGTGCTLSIYPPGRPYPTFTCNQVARAFPLECRFTVAQPRVLLLVADWSFLCNRSRRAIGSNRGVSPRSAQRSAASLIRGTALQRLLDRGMAILCLSGWRPDVALRPVCLQLAFCPKHPPGRADALGRTPWHARTVDFRRLFTCVQFCIAIAAIFAWNINMCDYVTCNYTALVRDSYTGYQSQIGIPHQCLPPPLCRVAKPPH